MNFRSTSSILTSLLLLQAVGVAHADNYSSYQRGRDLVVSPYTETTAPFEGSVLIGSVTRQTGGETFRLDLAKAIPLTQLKVKPKAGKVKLIETTLITDKQERIPVRALTNVNVAAADEAIQSENLNSASAIAGIEIKAEAMGGAADLIVKAISNQEAPQISLREDLSCKIKLDEVLKEKLDLVQKWAARVSSSAPGSIQEKYTVQEFNKYVNDFIVAVKGNKSAYASTEYTLTLLNFFVERYDQSPANSPAEIAYKSMATETLNAFLASIQSGQPCRTLTAEGLINIAIDFQKKIESAKADTRARQLFEMIVVQVGKIIPDRYRQELATKKYDFRHADNEGNIYYKLFLTSKPESFLKNTHRDMSLLAYAVAEQELTKEVKQMDNEKKYQLIVEFQAKYNDPANYHQDTMMKYLLIISEQGTLFKIYK